MPEISTDGGQTWLTIDLEHVMADEAEQLEDAFGFTWLDFVKGLQSGSAKSQRALVWLARHRTEPLLTPADVKYEMGQFQVKDEEEAVPLPTDSALSEPAT